MTTKSKRRKASSAWLQDHIHDPYVKLAQKDGYRARAAYKLKEIDEALRLVKPGTRVVDLGAAPGAWSQYLARRLAEPGAHGGLLIGLDILPMEPVPGMQFLQGDFREEAVLRQLETALGAQPVDLVVSDMAPNLSGIESSDAARMADLVELAVDFSRRHLKPDGALVCKVFHGSGYSQLVHLFKQSFRTAKPIKPRASRDRSSETYLVGLGPKP